MNLLKRVFKEYNGSKKSLISTAIFIMILVLFLSSYKSHFSTFFSNISHEKQELFSYLKDVQPIEDEFYSLVGDLPDEDNKNQSINNIKNAIEIIDRLLKELVDVKGSGPVQENKLFFTQEIKAVRNMLVEQRFWISNHDKVSLEKSKAYFDEYQMVSELRRDSLKNIFEDYDVQYIDLGNRIKYKVE